MIGWFKYIVKCYILKIIYNAIIIIATYKDYAFLHALFPALKTIGNIVICLGNPYKLLFKRANKHAKTV